MFALFLFFFFFLDPVYERPALITFNEGFSSICQNFKESTLVHTSTFIKISEYRTVAGLKLPE